MLEVIGLRAKGKLVLVNTGVVLAAFLAMALIVSRQVEDQQLREGRTRLTEVGALVASDLRAKEELYQAKARQFARQGDVVLYARALAHFGPLFAPAQREQTRHTLERTLSTLRMVSDLDAVEIWQEKAGTLALSAETADGREPVADWVRDFRGGQGHPAVIYRVVPGGLVLAVTDTLPLGNGRHGFLQLRRYVGPDFVSDVARSSGTDIALFAGDRYAVGTLDGIQPPAKSLPAKRPLVEWQTIDGERYQVTFQRLGTVGGQAMLLATALSAEPIITRAMQTTRAIFGMAVLAMIACSLLIYLWAARFLRPIDALMQGTAEIRRGNLEMEIPVSTRDELGLLAQRFNEMTQSLRASRDELVRSEKLVSVGKLSAGVAHEINNPLGTIINYLDLLLEDVRDGQVRDSLSQMRAEARRIKRTVRELLDFSRQSPRTMGPVQINAVVVESLNLVLHEQRMSGIEVKKRLQPGLPEAWGDADQLKQVFVNIILNAVQAMPEGGTLAVRTVEMVDAAGRLWVRAAFHDTGVGIAAEHLKYVFDPFFTTKGVGEGTGLGLSVSYGIVQAHGGSIRLDSSAGSGTEVLVDLPVRSVAVNR